MPVIPFDEKEMEVVGEANIRGKMTKIYNYPVTPGEAYKAALLEKKPVWIPGVAAETNLFCPSVIPDDVARGFVYEGVPADREKFGGPDMFGVEWVFVPLVNGSMVKPGKPTLEDVNDWKEVIKFPDIEAWDWAGSAEANAKFLDNNKSNSFWILNGMWFERMISFMDFEGAAMAVIDEDQVDAVKEMIHATTDLYIKLVDKAIETYKVLGGIYVHDDWGSQGAPFFSDAVAHEIFLPEMKRFVEHVHSKGLWCELHSCGHCDARADVFYEAGFDAWTPMAMNDTVEVWEKYGDKMCVGVINPFHFDPETATEEEQREAARKFANKFCVPGKLASWSSYNNAAEMTPAFREELYKQSRINYGNCQ